MSMSTQEIADLAREIRLQILHTIKGAGMGHIGGDFSVTDILATLFGAALTGVIQFCLINSHSAKIQCAHLLAASKLLLT